MGCIACLAASRLPAMAAVLVVGAALPIAAAPSPFDGVYKAEASGIGGLCHNFPAALRVSEGSATFKLNSTTSFEGIVSANGSVDVSVPSAVLSGRIADKVFHGHISGAKCQYDLVLPKQ